MMQFFSKTRTLTGLILILGPVLSLLSVNLTFSLCPAFFCSLLFSVVPLRWAMKGLSFRLWLILSCFFTIAGVFFSTLQNTSAPLFSAIFLGCGSCGLLLLLPPWLAVGRYVSPAPFLGLAWSAAFLAVLPLRLLFLASPETALPLMGLFAMSGLFLCSGKPPRRQLLQAPPHEFFSPSMVKTVIFFLTLLTSMGTCGGILLSKAAGSGLSSFQFPDTPAAILLFSTALAAGPVLSSWITERKGIYSSCIFSIFFCESSLLILCFPEGTAALAAGTALLLLTAGGITSTLPVLAFYLCGRTGYLRGLTPLLLCVPVSLLFSWTFWNLSLLGELDTEDTAVFLIFLLIMSFLCIFFAWKRRFIILKNSRI